MGTTKLQSFSFKLQLEVAEPENHAILKFQDMVVKNTFLYSNSIVVKFQIFYKDFACFCTVFEILVVQSWKLFGTGTTVSFGIVDAWLWAKYTFSNSDCYWIFRDFP